MSGARQEKRWVMKAGRCGSPICIVRRGSIRSPVWVWNNKALARRILSMMNDAPR